MSGIRGELSAPAAVAELLEDVAQAGGRRGLAPESECMTTVAAAGRFPGWRYGMTRELVDGLIDCSTLVSQSLWIGAGVGVPFIAETQRLAYSAVEVHCDGWLPGDVLVRYPSPAASPRKRHNHVGLYLGSDTSGTDWLLESRRPAGVRARPLYAEAALGGVRRFLPNPTRVFESQGPVLRLASATPKLGRIGARRRLATGRSDVHRGIDIYFDGPVEVVAPARGRAERQRDGVVHLYSAGGDSVVVLSSLEGEPGASDVDEGAPLGRCRRAERPHCNSVASLAHGWSLHVEYWTSQPLGYCEERLVTATARPPAEGMRAYNPIYAMKLGWLGLPVRIEDTGRALTLSPTPRAIGRRRAVARS